MPLSAGGMLTSAAPYQQDSSRQVKCHEYSLLLGFLQVAPSIFCSVLGYLVLGRGLFSLEKKKKSLKGQLIAVFHYLGAKEKLGPGFSKDYSEIKRDHSHKMQQEKFVFLHKKNIFHYESGEVLNKVTQKGTEISFFLRYSEFHSTELF